MPKAYSPRPAQAGSRSGGGGGDPPGGRGAVPCEHERHHAMAGAQTQRGRCPAEAARGRPPLRADRGRTRHRPPPAGGKSGLFGRRAAGGPRGARPRLRLRRHLPLPQAPRLQTLAAPQMESAETEQGPPATDLIGLPGPISRIAGAPRLLSESVHLSAAQRLRVRGSRPLSTWFALLPASAVLREHMEPGCRNVKDYRKKSCICRRPAAARRGGRRLRECMAEEEPHPCPKP